MKQLDLFEKQYGFLSQDEFLEVLATQKNTPRVVLTFDDGLKDHINFVLPELVKRKIFGFFYVCSGHYQNQQKKVMAVHRVHHLIAKHDSSVLLAEVIKDIDSSMLDQNLISEFDQEIYKDQNNSANDYKFKRMFNYYIKFDQRDIILDHLMKKYLNEQELYQKLYLTAEDLKEIELAGSIVGSHCVTHNILSRQTYDSQLSEIKDSFDYLGTFLKLKTRSFCFPYGGLASYNSDTLKILKELNIHHAFRVNNEEISDENLRQVHELNRLDCNRFTV